MTTTFNPALPTTKDQVRLRVGDTDGNPQWFLDDASIEALLAQYTYDEACAQAAEAIGGYCAQQTEMVVQAGLKIMYQKRSDKMFDLADRIRNLADPAPGSPPNYAALAGAICAPAREDDDPFGCGLY